MQSVIATRLVLAGLSHCDVGCVWIISNRAVESLPSSSQRIQCCPGFHACILNNPTAPGLPEARSTAGRHSRLSFERCPTFSLQSSPHQHTQALWKVRVSV